MNVKEIKELFIKNKYIFLNDILEYSYLVEGTCNHFVYSSKQALANLKRFTSIYLSLLDEKLRTAVIIDLKYELKEIYDLHQDCFISESKILEYQNYFSEEKINYLLNREPYKFEETFKDNYTPKYTDLQFDYYNLQFQKILNEAIDFVKTLNQSSNITDKTKIVNSLQNNDLETFINILKSIFSNNSYNVIKNIKPLEAYYQIILTTILNLELGIEQINTEKETNNGRIDLVAKTDNYIYVMEFKIKSNQKATPESAINQIKDKKYYSSYLHLPQKIILVGIVFDEKNIASWSYENYSNL